MRMQWRTRGGAKWHGHPPVRAPPLGQAAKMHVHPGVLHNITNNKIFQLFVEKNPRILDFLKFFIIFFQRLFFLV